MADVKTPKLEEGEVLDRPPARVAPILANATPQERLAAVLRRIDTARTTYKLGAVELRPAPTGPRTVVPPGLPALPTGRSTGSLPRTAAHPDIMFSYPDPPRFSQNYVGGDTGYGNGSPTPVPSRSFQSMSGGRGMAHSIGSPTPGSVPVARGGGREGRNAGPIQQLSSECQRRRFNPEFKITMHDNRYRCDVLVQTVVIQGSKHYDNPYDAKTHTALKALKTVQSWPVPSSATTAAASGGRQEPQRASKVPKVETEKEVSGPSGPSTASGVDMSDPLQAKAFVEGFRMGQLAAAPNGRSIEAHPEGKENKRISESLRSRSRSPRRRRRDSRHRSRSARPYFDGSRHDPSLPSTDKYRPSGSEPWRRGVGQLAREESYGRLKQDEYY